MSVHCFNSIQLVWTSTSMVISPWFIATNRRNVFSSTTSNGRLTTEIFIPSICNERKRHWTPGLWRTRKVPRRKSPWKWRHRPWPARIFSSVLAASFSAVSRTSPTTSKCSRWNTCPITVNNARRVALSWNLERFSPPVRSTSIRWSPSKNTIVR